MNNYNSKIVAKRIKECRLAKSLTQEDLAHLLGKSRTNIVNYEAGRNILPGNVIVDLSNILKVSTDYLLGLSDDTFSAKNDLYIRKLQQFMYRASDEKRERAMKILQLVFKDDF